MTRESPFRQAEPVEAWFLTLDCRLRGNDEKGASDPRPVVACLRAPQIHPGPPLSGREHPSALPPFGILFSGTDAQSDCVQKLDAEAQGAASLICPLRAGGRIPYCPHGWVLSDHTTK